VEKVREELERCQSTLGKLQLQQEKTQQGYDKAQNDVDRLQERLDKALVESRKVRKSWPLIPFLKKSFISFFFFLHLFISLVFGSVLSIIG
jgi:uncharacterized membrane protein (DUF106 family)